MSIVAPAIAYAPEINAAAARHGLDPALLAAVAAQETGGPGADSGRNVVGDGGHGRGLFQIDDRYHAFARSAGAMDPAANADYAAGMLSSLLQRYGGNVHDALSAYNAGNPHATGTVTSWQDGAHLGYADSVLRHYSQLTRSTPPMSNFLTNIVHGVERGVETLVSTGNPIAAASSAICAPQTPQMPAPLLNQLQADNPAEQQNVNALSSYANNQISPFADLVNS